MAERTLEVHALAPLLFRDGRPFTAADGTETSAQSMPAPLPSTLAGFVRTQVGNGLGWDWSRKETLENAHGIGVNGPLLVRDGCILLPAPKDAVIYGADTPEVISLKPFERVPDGAGCDLPDGLVPLEVGRDEKPATGYALWTTEMMTHWLLGEKPEKLEKISLPPEEQRTHVGIDPASGRANDGVLYSVAYRSLESSKQHEKPATRWENDHRTWTIRARVTLPEPERPPERVGHFGGERRPATVGVLERNHWFCCPNTVRSKVKAKSRIRLILATPAIFEHGWKPAWLERTGAPNQPAGLGKVKLKLVAAAVGRREAVSGWNLRENAERAVRWMVPAGSVYFFEVLEGDPDHLLESWLRPVSDLEQDRKDGFGLALWGVW